MTLCAVMLGFVNIIAETSSAPSSQKDVFFQNMSEGEVLRFLQKCIRIIRSASIDPVDNIHIIEGALQGILQHLDPHSAYFPPHAYAQMNEQLSGEICGVGVVFTKTDQGLYVIACVDDTPAAKAGIRSGDIIVAVDDVSAPNNIFDVSVRLKGKLGTPVKISVERKGEKQWLHFNLLRSRIELKSVKHRIENHIGMIRLSSFDKKTATLLSKAIKDIQKLEGSHLQGLIIDLRSNPGGSVAAAIDCCRLFINKGALVRARGRDNTPEEVSYALGSAIVTATPVVVLVDGGTASAAEMMAGALQDHQIALIMGVKSFGKGTTQILLDVPHPKGGGGLKITTQRWYTPKGHPIQQQGIMPDITVEAMEKPKPLNDDVNLYREGDIMGSLKMEKPLKGESDLASAVEGSAKKGGEGGLESQTEQGRYDYQMERAQDMIRGLSWQRARQPQVPLVTGPQQSGKKTAPSSPPAPPAKST